MKYRVFCCALACFLPWPLRRWVLNTFLGYRLHPTARLGWCLTAPGRLIMEENSSIGHGTVCLHLDLVHLKPHATIGRGNWITGFPTASTEFFAHEAGRRAELIVHEHAAITNRHLIDCTSSVTIGQFTTFAGFQSQILTHSIDLEENRQASSPIEIGAYCFIGTNCVLLGGCRLPDYSVLGAKSLLTKSFTEDHVLYGGAPAARIKALAPELKYFGRSQGVVH